MDEPASIYLPHRPPMIMIDELVEASESKAISTFKATWENIFVEDGKFLEAGLMENIAQTAAAQAGFYQKKNNRPVTIGYLAAIKSWSMIFLPEVNSKLVTTITVMNQIGEITLLKGEVHSEKKLVCTCEMRIFVKQNQETN